MDLLDHYAAAALQGILAHPSNDLTASEAATEAFRIARAMLAARDAHFAAKKPNT